jgi:hypothetical protein
MEAEYVSAYPSVQEVTWIRAVLHHLELTRDKPTTLLIDNKSAIDLAHNPVHHQRSKRYIIYASQGKISIFASQMTRIKITKIY